MRYDVLLTDVGSDRLSVSLVVMNTIQQLAPLPVLNLNDARQWLTHLPVLLRRGIAGDEARTLQQRYERLGAAVAVIPTKLFFPTDTDEISNWRNEWYSEHLVALHERVLSEWAQDADIDEGYRFSFLPSFGWDMTMRVWLAGDDVHACARRSIGRIRPLPGPPELDLRWSPSQEDWQRLREAIASYQFWESETWNTVPDGYSLLDSNHWVMEGWRDVTYHVLVDQTPNEGAAREVGLLLLGLLPEDFITQEIE